ncbi:hydrogenase expression/formation protein HypE [Clostridium sp. ZS2-4]|uniref:hydrogenase expression/formation protein HypE n=1 Tax=Clostridium sp. ZS2-4 TaxID=2987703 RepID=UPI00227B51E5|nr:hydrogenase expression/formation protein HypE [Clostridium sp. ZS2-4]MCY6356236.1 hydrogenase expression/formation protein HypE [Clostridium sp. ZS2-4]
MNTKNIELIHGDGGKYTGELIEKIFYRNFQNDILLEDMDSALLSVDKGKIAFTTDSFVVNPIFFRGGDIGKLAVCGTVNDLTVSGAYPICLSAGFIIEEGFSLEKLERIADSMGKICEQANVKIVTGDTKVVPKGKVDGVFINTSGIGIIKGYTSKEIQAGDSIIVTGTIGEHGTAIEVDRYNLKVEGNIQSDCAPLNYLLDCLEKYKESIKLMKDPTRGGIGEILNEISKKSKLGIHIFEKNIPIREEVKGINEMLGINPLYLASEGRMILVVESSKAEEIKEELKKQYGCVNASIIGDFTDRAEFVYIENGFGGKRILNSLDTQMLPRIC